MKSSAPLTRFCIVRHGETAWNAQKRYQGQLDIDLNATGIAQARALRSALAPHMFSATYASDLKRAWHTAQIATAGLSAADACKAPAIAAHIRESVLAESAAARIPVAVASAGYLWGGQQAGDVPQRVRPDGEAARPGMPRSGCSLAVSPAPTLRERHYGVFQGLTVAEAEVVHPQAHGYYSARSLDYDFETGESLLAFSQRVLDAFARLADAHAGGNVLVFTHGGVLDIIYRAAVHRDLRSVRDFHVPNAAINWLRYESNAWQIETWGECGHLASMDRALDEVMQ